MNFANKFRIDRYADHVVVHFKVMTDAQNPENIIDEPAGSIALPITTAGELGIAMFDALMASGHDLTAAFVFLQQQINTLNAASAQPMPTGAQVQPVQPSWKAPGASEPEHAAPAATPIPEPRK